MRIMFPSSSSISSSSRHQQPAAADGAQQNLHGLFQSDPRARTNRVLLDQQPRNHYAGSTQMKQPDPAQNNDTAMEIEEQGDKNQLSSGTTAAAAPERDKFPFPALADDPVILSLTEQGKVYDALMYVFSKPAPKSGSEGEKTASGAGGHHQNDAGSHIVPRSPAEADLDLLVPCMLSATGPAIDQVLDQIARAHSRTTRAVSGRPTGNALNSATAFSTAGAQVSCSYSATQYYDALMKAAYRAWEMKLPLKMNYVVFEWHAKLLQRCGPGILMRTIFRM
ncbi:unnamed protein product [Amoebophrya sp. A120]|nr:unnamed protein product [Amoebophrya sp. A120]|eukprot:GSA120T00016218001.1